jgi:hypothetical protein
MKNENPYCLSLLRIVARILSKMHKSSLASIKICDISDMFGYNSFSSKSQYSLSDASLATTDILCRKSLFDSARFASR